MTDPTKHQAFWFVSRFDGTFIVSFTALDRRAGDATIYRFEVEGLARFTAIAAWIGERQHLWPRWRSIAERKGVGAMSADMARLLEREPAEAFVAAMVIAPSEHAPDVVVAAGMATRRLDILEHRFASLARRDAFLAWANAHGEGEVAKALSLIGLLRGRKALAATLDRIADDPSAGWPDTATRH